MSVNKAIGGAALGIVVASVLFVGTTSANQNVLAANNTNTEVSAGNEAKASFDKYSVMINGERQFIYSGEFDYWRMPSQSAWKDILQKMKSAGFNAVTIYFNWGFHSPKEGEYDFSGVRDVDKLLDMAQEAGLYVIARPGPYINAEIDAGGFPDWILTDEGKARTSDPEYTKEYMEWLDHIDPILKRHQISYGGNIIMYQVENEYTGTDAKYMSDIEAKVKKDGINVPTFHNDKSQPNGLWAPGTEGGAQMYGFDMYTKIKAMPENVSKPREFAPKSPIILGELGNGWFDQWAHDSYPAIQQKYGVEYNNELNRSVIGQGATVLSFYMGYGGTTWGYLPSPYIYTSYDYAAMIHENRTLWAKYGAQKRLALMVTTTPSLMSTYNKYSGGLPGNSKIRLEELENPDDHAQFYTVRHEKGDSLDNDLFDLTIDSADGKSVVPVRLNGESSKIIPANLKLGNQHLVYSTNELMTHFGDKTSDVALFYTGNKEVNATVLKYATKPSVSVKSGSVNVKYDKATGQLKLVNKFSGVAEVVIKQDGKTMTVLLTTDKQADTFWRQDTKKGTMLESGPYLVRTANVSGKTLNLTGDTEGATALKVYTANGLKNVTWNGKNVDLTQTKGTLEGTVGAPKAKVTLPKLTNWKTKDASPETQTNFDDSKWVDADHTTTTNTTKPESLPVLYEDDYGFHHGNVWFRGHFNGTGKETGITLHGLSANTNYGAYSVWLNGKFIGTADGTHDFTFPDGAIQKGKDNVVSVLVANMGHEQDSDSTDTQKHPRGLQKAVLDGVDNKMTWKIQGNLGGEDIQDPTRGSYNYGGLIGEREGWTLNGFDDSSWSDTTLPHATNKAGVTWYRTNAKLDLPKGYDVPVSLKFADNATYKYRAFVYVNGWLIGQYINNLGPQHTFPIPAGILNSNGDNSISIGVWGLDDDGARLGNVSLVADDVIEGDFKVDQVTSPSYSDLASKLEKPAVPLTDTPEVDDEKPTVKATPEAIKYGKYVTVTHKNYTLWGDLNFKTKRNQSNTLLNQTFLAKVKYNHDNGSTYLSLYNAKGAWLGYINATGVKVGKGAQGAAISANQYVTLTGKSGNIWGSFSWNSIRHYVKNYTHHTYLVKTIYNHANGSSYYSLYSTTGKWFGYVNAKATTPAKVAQGVAVSFNKTVKIKHGNYTIWGNFFSKKVGNSSTMLNKSYTAKVEYFHANGSTYYSLYQGKHWVGYVNSNVTK